jgi:LmbE family N-acetylglucosaminyl deacetylase
MKFEMKNAQTFIPDGLPEAAALARTTHLAIGAHQDDLEIMAVEGILTCFQQPHKWFTGVVVTDGRGSPRSGSYANYTNDEMWAVRIAEQKKAAVIGEFAAQILLDFPSKAVKTGSDQRPVEDIGQILAAARPDVVYTHNLADKHDTHIGVALKVIEAIRQLPTEHRPRKLYGCEVWRDLDWLVDDDKVTFNCSAHENLQMALVAVFDSQVAGGKRYDLATMGRRQAHATYHSSHQTDAATGLNFGMDLTPLIENTTVDPLEYVQEFVIRFADDIRARFARAQS